MRNVTSWACAVVLGVGLCATASAQEVQVPLDEAGTLLVIDAEQEQRLGLFAAYEGFREARLFEQPDGSYVLEVTYAAAGQVRRDRTPMTTGEVQRLRGRVTAGLAARPVAPVLDQSGRPWLLTHAALRSIFFYGPALPYILDVDDPSTAGAVYLMSASAGFFVPFFLTRKAPVTRGAMALSGTGAALGAVSGLGLAALVSGEDATGRGLVASAVGLSIAGSAVGYRVATRANLDEGSAQTIGAVGLYGGVAGLLTSAALAGEWEDDSPRIRAFAGLGLLGMGAGLYGGHRLSRAEPFTPGDAAVLATAGTVGFVAGLTAADLADVENARSGALIGLAGTTAGMAAGRILAHDVDFTRDQGVFISLGTLAGGLFGAGIATLVERREEPRNVTFGDDPYDPNPDLYFTLITLGAATGFGLMYRIYLPEARAAHRERGPTTGSLRLRVHPEGLLLGWRQGTGAAPAFPVRLFSVAKTL